MLFMWNGSYAIFVELVTSPEPNLAPFPRFKADRKISHILNTSCLICPPFSRPAVHLIPLSELLPT